MLRKRADLIANRQCPDCGTPQHQWTMGMRNKLIARPSHHVEPCPGCETPLRLQRRTGLEILYALAFIFFGSAVLFIGLTRAIPPGLGEIAVGLIAAAIAFVLYATAILGTGLMARHTRSVHRKDDHP